MRKDNEMLMKELRRDVERSHSQRHANAYKQEKSLTEPQKPLKGRFEDYTSECIDVTSPCERLDPEYQNHLNRKYVQKGGIDVEAFREWCRALDADQAWIEKTEKELF